MIMHKQQGFLVEGVPVVVTVHRLKIFPLFYSQLFLPLDFTTQLHHYLSIKVEIINSYIQNIMRISRVKILIIVLCLALQCQLLVFSFNTTSLQATCYTAVSLT